MSLDTNSYMLIALLVTSTIKMISHVVLHFTGFRSNCCGKICTSQLNRDEDSQPPPRRNSVEHAIESVLPL